MSLFLTNAAGGTAARYFGRLRLFLEIQAKRPLDHDFRGTLDSASSDPWLGALLLIGMALT
jgi:hypothetical protein